MDDKQRQSVAWGSGIAIGLGVGVAIGVATDELGLWIPLGLGLGIVFAATFGGTTATKKKPDTKKADGDGATGTIPPSSGDRRENDADDGDGATGGDGASGGDGGGGGGD